VDDQIDLAERRAALGVDERMPPVRAADLVDAQIPRETDAVCARQPHQPGLDRLLGDAAIGEGRRLGWTASSLEDLERPRRL
jgi:hypothetical protein